MILKPLRFFTLIIYAAFAFFIGLIVTIIRPLNSSNNFVAGRIFAWGAFKIMGIDFEVRNKHNFDKRPCVFISNHQDNIDMIVGSASIPKQTVTLGKTSIIYIPIFGLFYWLAGNILINRSNRRKSKASMEKVTNSIAKKGISVWVMPEGTRGRGREILLPFKRGAFVTAIDAKAPVVPIIFSTYHKKLDYTKLKSGKIVAYVFDPIDTSKMERDNAHELKDLCHKKMKAKLLELNEELNIKV